MAKVLNRGQLRAQVLVRCGFTSDDDELGNPVVAQVNAYLEQAQERIYAEDDWSSATREATFQTAIGQYQYNYPTSDEDGNTIVVRQTDVLSAWIWDTGRDAYCELGRRPIHPNQVPDAGLLSGDDLTSQYDEPTHFDTRQQLHLAPTPDAVYTVRLVVQTVPTFNDADATDCVADAEAIILYACQMLLHWQGDVESAQRFREDYERRILHLRAGENGRVALQPGRLDKHLRRQRRRQRHRFPGREPFDPSW